VCRRLRLLSPPPVGDAGYSIERFRTYVRPCVVYVCDCVCVVVELVPYANSSQVAFIITSVGVSRTRDVMKKHI